MAEHIARITTRISLFGIPIKITLGKIEDTCHTVKYMRQYVNQFLYSCGKQADGSVVYTQDRISVYEFYNGFYDWFKVIKSGKSNREKQEDDTVDLFEDGFEDGCLMGGFDYMLETIVYERFLGSFILDNFYNFPDGDILFDRNVMIEFGNY